MIARLLPENWEKALLGDLATVFQGQSPPGSTYNVDGVGLPFLQGSAEFGELNPSPVKWCSEPIRVAEPGDILISIRAPVGPTNVADRRYCIGRGLAAIRASRHIESAFLLHQLRHSVAALIDQGAGTTFDAIGGDVLRTHVVLVPPFAEEGRIVEAIESLLSRIDAAVASLERVRARLKAYRTSVLKYAVEGRVVPTEAELARKEGRSYESAETLLARLLKERRRRWEDAELAKMTAADKAPEDDKWKAKYKEPAAPVSSKLPKLAEGWCWASVDQVGDVLLGRQRAPQYLTGKCSRPYLRVANVKDDRIELADIEEMDFDERHFEKYRLQSGDVLASEGQSPHLVGQSAIYRGGVDGLCFQKTLHRFRPVDHGPTAEFAQLVFRAHVRMRVFQDVASITTNIAHLTLVKFKESRFPLPPASEQERIVAETQRLLSIADSVDQQVKSERTRLTRLRQGVLKWAFEGKLVDQDPADEPAEKLLARIRTERATAAPGKKTRARRVKPAT